MKIADHDATDAQFVCRQVKTLEETAKAIYYFGRVVKTILPFA